MAKVFDPYHVWLGIPSGDRPINHYRLLGIEVFEDDPEVIDSAAERQMAHLRTFQGGSHSSLSQQLLNEVAAARVCLLRPEKKAVYDEQLRGRLSPKVAVPAASQVEASASEAAGATTWEYLEQILPATSASRAARPTVSRLNQVAAVAVVATIALLLAITWLVVGKKTTPAPARPADAPVATGEVAKPKPLASERPAVAAPVETASAAQGKPSSAAVEPPAAKDVMAKNNAPENQLPKTEPVRAEPPKSETAARTVPKTAAVEARVLSFHLQPRQQVMGPLVNYSRPVRLQLSEKPPQPAHCAWANVRTTAPPWSSTKRKTKLRGSTSIGTTTRI
jgi:hypothetical protein